MKKRVVITGGTGLVGTALSAALVARGYHVVATGIGPVTQTEGDGTTLVQWDGENSSTLLPYLNGAAGVVHLCGSSVNQRWSAKGKQNILQSRLASGAALLANLRSVQKKPGVLIQASAIGYYGDTGQTTVDEQSVQGHSWIAGVCAAWEASTLQAAKLGMRHCIIRTAPVLAAGGFLAERTKPFGWHVGGPIGNPDRWVSWISIRDEVEAIVFLLENKKTSGAYNLASPQPVQEKTFAEVLGSVLNRASWFPIPLWLLRVRFEKQQLEEFIGISARVQPSRLLEAGFVFKDQDLRAAIATACGAAAIRSRSV